MRWLRIMHFNPGARIHSCCTCTGTTGSDVPPCFSAHPYALKGSSCSAPYAECTARPKTSSSVARGARPAALPERTTVRIYRVHDKQEPLLRQETA